MTSASTTITTKNHRSSRSNRPPPSPCSRRDRSGRSVRTRPSPNGSGRPAGPRSAGGDRQPSGASAAAAVEPSIDAESPRFDAASIPAEAVAGTGGEPGSSGRTPAAPIGPIGAISPAASARSQSASVSASTSSRRTARRRSSVAIQTNTATWTMTTNVTPGCERMASPRRSQSVMPGFLKNGVSRIAIEVREAGQGEDHVGDPPADRGRGQDGPDGERRKQIALVDAGRQDEERHREERHGHDEQAAVVDQRPDRTAGREVQDERRATRIDRHDRADGHDREQQEGRSDVQGGDPGDERGGLVGLRAGHVPDRVVEAVLGQPVAVLGQQGPRVIGVDRDVRVAAGRLGDHPEQADGRQPERQAQQDRGREPDRRARHEPDGTLAQPGQPRFPGRSGGDEGGRVGVRLERRRGSQPGDQVTAQEDHHEDRDEDPELRLDDRRHDREERRAFGSAPPQVADAEQQEDDPDRVDLAPDRAVEPGHRVDQDEDRPEQRGPPRAAELEDERVDQPGQRPRRPGWPAA